MLISDSNALDCCHGVKPRLTGHSGQLQSLLDSGNLLIAVLRGTDLWIG